MIDERSYTILIQNLLNRAVDIEIARCYNAEDGEKVIRMDNIECTLEELKDLFRGQLQLFQDKVAQ